MIVIYAQDPSPGRRVANLVSTEAAVVTAWPDLQTLAARAQACILVLGSLDGMNLPERLTELHRWSAHAPVALVMPLSEENATALAAVVTAIAGVVWLHRLDDPDLARVLQDFLGKPLQSRFADAVRAADRIPAADRHLLARLCESEPPPSDAATAARLVGESPANLRRKISTALGSLTGHATNYLLQWLRLLWACDPARTGQKEAALGRRLGTTTSSLQRTAKGLTEVTLEELRRGPEGVLRMALRACRLGEE